MTRANDLARAIVPGPQVSAGSPAPPPPRHTRGVVVAVVTSTTCTLHIDGDTTVAIPATNPPWATLTATQVVEVLISGARALVIG